jgi:hypothetical protein
MNSKNFFAELKRRNVYKVAVAYAVVAWLLIQAASIFFPAFEPYSRHLMCRVGRCRKDTKHGPHHTGCHPSGQSKTSIVARIQTMKGSKHPQDDETG